MHETEFSELTAGLQPPGPPQLHPTQPHQTQPRPPLELWTGVECTLNRVGDVYLNQLQTNGHDRRAGDLELLASLGARRIRYPVLWEQVQPEQSGQADWRWTDARLTRLRELALEPIATLLHHGSGPRYTSLLDPQFPEQLAEYARQVAERYPWLRAYTPVNEPLTTARFSGLYGVWYPHHASDESFVRALLNQCRGTVLAMRAVRAVQPAAELIQTDDLGMAHATPAMQPEADFQNHRRWLAFDLLCGRVTEAHPLWNYLRASGASREELDWLAENPCPPDVIGVDYYVTSERFLDERREAYHPHHRNATHADIEAVRVFHNPAGIAALLRETWERYRRPVAVTEAHLGSTREEQLRWFDGIWQAAQTVRDEGAEIRAVTCWAALGSFDWNTLHTALRGHYEPGPFDVRSPEPRPTALAGLLRDRAAGRQPTHPTLDTPGFWLRPDRFHYPAIGTPEPAGPPSTPARPLLILGSGMLGQAVAQLCQHRGLAYRQLSSAELVLPDLRAAQALLDEAQPWAVVSTTGYGRIEEAERHQQQFWTTQVTGLTLLAQACQASGVGLLSFSSDQVFAGERRTPYQELDAPAPLNAYGRARLAAEAQVLAAHPGALIVRSAALFGAETEVVGDRLAQALRTLGSGAVLQIDHHHRFSPTFLPDLVQTSLDLLIDAERGIWHLVNQGEATWAEVVRTVAGATGLPLDAIRPLPGTDPGWLAPRPRYSALASRRGQLLPRLDSALERYAAQAARW